MYMNLTPFTFSSFFFSLLERDYFFINVRAAVGESCCGSLGRVVRPASFANGPNLEWLCGEFEIQELVGARLARRMPKVWRVWAALR